LSLAPVLAARTLVEAEPNYTYVSARLLLDKLRREALSFVAGSAEEASHADMATRYAEYFPGFLKVGIAAELIDPELARFDVACVAAALKPERDLQFDYLGPQTLYDRYFLHVRGNRFELPQAFFMRVAMGLAIREIDREAKAIEFYDLISSFAFMCSTVSPHLPRGTRRAAPDEKSRNAVALGHAQLQGQRHRSQVAKENRASFAWPQRNLSSPLDRRAR
jgi:ribonucleoside-diphosphate reductase alpha chain